MRQLPEMAGRVFTDDIPMPEPPKPGFLKGASSLLFGGGPKNVDREELFGENAGKPGSGVAKHVTGPNMAPVMAQSAQGTSEVGKCKQSARVLYLSCWVMARHGLIKFEFCAGNTKIWTF